MRELSPEATTLLASAGRPAEAARALPALANLAEPALVPRLAPFVFDGPPAVRRAAAEALDRALDAATPAELLQIDEECRPWWSTAGSVEPPRGPETAPYGGSAPLPSEPGRGCGT